MASRDRSILVRDWVPKGTLKDFIHQSNPRLEYPRKYTKAYPLNEKIIANFGRQILEALYFLEIQGYPFYHLHSGNILVINNTILLTDLENSLLCLEPYYLQFLRQLGSKVDLHVVCFACILFEMAMGFELESVDALDLGVPDQCPREIKKILENIFQPWYGSPPSVEDLLQMPPFSTVPLNKEFPRKKIKWQGREGELLKGTTKILKKIVDSPAAADELLVKEEERKKKKKARQREKQQQIIQAQQAANPVPVDAPVVPSPAPVAPKAPASPSPPPAPAKAAPPPPPGPPAGKPPSNPGRGGLLGSIEGFSKNKLKKAVTVDKSGPLLKAK